MPQLEPVLPPTYHKWADDAHDQSQTCLTKKHHISLSYLNKEKNNKHKTKQKGALRAARFCIVSFGLYFVSIFVYCVSIDFCATERILFCLNPPSPKGNFQNSNFPKINKIQKNNCARTLPHPLFPPWSVQNCVFLKIGILDFCDVLGYFKIVQFPWK